MVRPKRNVTKTTKKAPIAKNLPKASKSTKTQKSTKASKPTKPQKSTKALKSTVTKSKLQQISKKKDEKNEKDEKVDVSKEKSPNVLQRKVEVVFSFDTTASMYPCLTQVRCKIRETVERLFKELGTENLRIGISAHGDYCCEKEVYLTKHLPMTSNIDTIVQFVENVEPTWGYTYPEAYEVVLHEVQNFAWLDDWAHILVMIGDDVPHEKDDNPRNLDWREEVDKLKAMNVTIHGVQALNRKWANNFYAELARRTDGCHLALDQFSSIVDLIVAVCYKESNQSRRLEQYEKEVQSQPGRYNRSVRYMFDKMMGRTVNQIPPPGDMNAVDPGRFQVLDVNQTISIKDFVLKQGIKFKKGRGFYEFNKPETVQKYKEIVIMSKETGDMFEGNYARTLLGLPANSDVKIKPSEHDDYFFFIQSNSHNRNLTAGTKFLYEVPDEA